MGDSKKKPPFTSQHEQTESPLVEAGHPYPVGAVAREWGKIKNDPHSYISVGIACFLVGVGLVYSLYNIFLIPSKDALIQFWQVKAENAGVSVNDWKPLSEEQQTEWINTLSSYKIRTTFINLSGSSTERLGLSLYNVFQKSHSKYVDMETNYSPKGISFSISKHDPIKDTIEKLVKSYYPDVAITEAETPYNEADGSYLYFDLGAC